MIGRHGDPKVRGTAAAMELEYIHVEPRWVSAAHCTVVQNDDGTTWLEQADGCLNGVFLNDSAVPIGRVRTHLCDGDVVHLVLSHAPVRTDVAYVVRLGSGCEFGLLRRDDGPRAAQLEHATTHELPGRVATSALVTVDQDLICGICFDPMVGAVTVDCCRRNFDAGCLARCWQAQWAAAGRLNCPLCRAVPSTVQANESLRRLVAEAVTAGRLDAPSDGHTQLDCPPGFALPGPLPRPAVPAAAVCTADPDLIFFSSTNDAGAVAGRLAAGADVNGRRADGWSALMLAAEAGAMRTAEVLLAAPGININCTNPGGGTALFPAARHGHQSIVRRLLAAGANVNHADHNGWNVLMLAAEHGQEAVVEELLATPGIDVHAANRHGGTALFPAARHGHEGIVQRLLVAGCNAGAVDGEGMAAAAVAVQHGRHELARSLAAASRMQLAQTD